MILLMNATRKCPCLSVSFKSPSCFRLIVSRFSGNKPTGRLLVEYGNRFAVTDVLLKLARVVVSNESAGWESQRGGPNWCRVSVAVSVVRLRCMDGEPGDAGTRLSFVGS